MIKSFNQMYEMFMNHTNEDYTAMCFNETAISFTQLKRRVDEIARHLIRLGIRTGQGVGYTLDNGVDVIPLQIAVSRIGAYAMPLFTGFPPVQKINLFQKAEVSLIVTNYKYYDDLLETARNASFDVKIAVVENDSIIDNIYGDVEEKIELSEYLVDSEEMDQPLLIGFSSGTTGIPKMVAMSQKNVGAEMISMMDLFNHSISFTENDSHIMAFPFSTSVMLTVIASLFYGTRIIYTDDMSPMNFLRNIERWNATSIMGPPAYLESLLLLKEQQDYDLSSVRFVMGGMDFFSPSILSRLCTMFPNMRYHSGGYGLVETCNVYMEKSIDILEDDLSHAARFNLAVSAENEIKVCDEQGQEVADGEIGEIYVKGPNVVKGYMKSPKQLLEEFPEGWLQTGDICRKIDSTTVQLMGREKYFIKRGGKSISPIVVQNEINKTKGVKDSAVVGVPHVLFGEMIWAFVVKKPGEEVSLKDIKKTCKEVLPYYMLPDQVTFIDDIPKNGGVGKVNYEKIRELGQEELKKIANIQ
ncbi:MAG: acyl--CoA ligase [Clostridium sp.]|nr:acyl--CoA ligase [Clostridium sp.]